MLSPSLNEKIIKNLINRKFLLLILTKNYRHGFKPETPTVQTGWIVF